MGRFCMYSLKWVLLKGFWHVHRLKVYEMTSKQSDKYDDYWRVLQKEQFWNAENFHLRQNRHLILKILNGKRLFVQIC